MRCRSRPGKRITTSQAPLIALRDGKPLVALGLPGGLRIFGSAMQALINLIDHGMSLQEAVEAPRIWTQGRAHGPVEIEAASAPRVRAELRAMGHDGGRAAACRRRDVRHPLPR